MTQDDAADLLGRIASGDAEAFHALYRASSDVLFGVLIRMLRDRARAEDGLQEVFTRIWLRAGSFVPSRGSGMTWMITIARNYAIDQRRQRVTGKAEGVEVDQLADPRGGPDDYLVARGDVARIVFCLGTLDPRHADCIKGAYLDGLSYSDLAARHGVPVNTMRTWLRRGLIRLRDCVVT